MKNKFLFAIVIVLTGCNTKQWLQQLEQKADSLQTVIEEMKNRALAPQVWNHKIDWFEIPAEDMQRSKKFYETILDIQMQSYEGADSTAGNYSMAFFADMNDSASVSGALVKMKDFVPSDKGVLVYLHAGDDLAIALGKVEQAGGKIIMPKTGIGPNHEHGFMAIFIDTEGNRIALHSIK